MIIDEGLPASLVARRLLAHGYGLVVVLILGAFVSLDALAGVALPIFRAASPRAVALEPSVGVRETLQPHEAADIYLVCTDAERAATEATLDGGKPHIVLITEGRRLEVNEYVNYLVSSRYAERVIERGCDE